MTATVYSEVAGSGRGGDIHYFSVCSYDILTRVVIADVRGHGEAAAELSHWLYVLLLEHMNSLDGAAILEALNQKVCEQGFMALTTAAVVSYNRNDHKLHFASAGHPPPYVYCSKKGWKALLLDERTGIANVPLGIAKAARFDQQSYQLCPGDRLFLYTDGLTECPAPGGEFFDEERLADSLSLSGEVPLHQLKMDLLGRLRAFSGGQLDHDDCTFLCFELRPEHSIDSQA